MKTLVIGGTGMLAKASDWLIQNESVVTLLSRNRRSYLFDQYPEIKHISCDYTNEVDFVNKLHQCEVFDLIVAWIHGEPTPCLRHLFYHQKDGKWRLVHVLGSASNVTAFRQQLGPPTNCLYIPVQLGFVREENSSRWLTNDEISGGVIQAIMKNKAVQVGQI